MINRLRSGFGGLGSRLVHPFARKAMNGDRPSKAPTRAFVGGVDDLRRRRGSLGIRRVRSRAAPKNKSSRIRFRGARPALIDADALGHGGRLTVFYSVTLPAKPQGARQSGSQLLCFAAAVDWPP